MLSKGGRVELFPLYETRRLVDIRMAQLVAQSDFVAHRTFAPPRFGRPSWHLQNSCSNSYRYSLFPAGISWTDHIEALDV